MQNVASPIIIAEVHINRMNVVNRWWFIFLDNDILNLIDFNCDISYSIGPSLYRPMIWFRLPMAKRNELLS